MKLMERPFFFKSKSAEQIICSSFWNPSHETEQLPSGEIFKVMSVIIDCLPSQKEFLYSYSPNQDLSIVLEKQAVDTTTKEKNTNRTKHLIFALHTQYRDLPTITSAHPGIGRRIGKARIGPYRRADVTENRLRVAVAMGRGRPFSVAPCLIYPFASAATCTSLVPGCSVWSDSGRYLASRPAGVILRKTLDADHCVIRRDVKSNGSRT